MRQTLHIAHPEHQVAFQEVVDLVRRHADKLSAAEMLAVAANMLGKLIALQDQRTMTPERAMEIVAKNIEHGNAEARKQLLDSPGGHA